MKILLFIYLKESESFKVRNIIVSNYEYRGIYMPTRFLYIQTNIFGNTGSILSSKLSPNKKL